MNARHSLMLLVTALLLTACGIETDDSPRDVSAADQQQLLAATDRSAGQATGTARVYLLAPEVAGQSQALRAVARDVSETAFPLLTELFAGPNAAELSGQFRTALPAGVQLLSTSRRGENLIINVSKDLGQLSGDVLVAAVAQIVFTASGVSGVQAVKILIEGADQQWPAGNGVLQSLPLTVYDFPGLVQSAQPPYPAIPTPAEP